MQITQTLSVLHTGSRGLLALDARQFPDGCYGESGRVAVKLERSAVVEDEQMIRSIDEPSLDPPGGHVQSCRVGKLSTPHLLLLRGVRDMSLALAAPRHSSCARLPHSTFRLYCLLDSSLGPL